MLLPSASTALKSNMYLKAVEITTANGLGKAVEKAVEGQGKAVDALWECSERLVSHCASVSRMEVCPVAAARCPQFWPSPSTAS